VLRPLKAKTLIPQVAKQLELSEETVKDIITYYWQEIRTSLSSLKHQRIHISNLGDFTIKEWKIEDKIARIENFETANKLKGLQLINARFRTAESLYELHSLKKQIKEESQRAEFIKLHKKTVNETKQHHTDLEAQGSNPGGDNEQHL
jgi:nucleoid DNA-binding protein